MGLPKLKPSKPKFTVAEYLAMERKAEERHEYLDGEIIAMAGESSEHGDISVNIVVSLGSQLKSGPCRVRTKDTKVRSGPVLTAGKTSKCLFSYPDIVVICGEPEHLDEVADVILNPTAIIEVLSPSTEAYDRGQKFLHYQIWNSTLKDYLLVSQERPQIEHYSRQSDGSWCYRLHTGLEACVAIPSIQCTLKLAEVYERVKFGEEASPESEHET